MSPGAEVTLQSEMRLDRLAVALAGKAREGGLERLLAANPGLAAEGSFAPAGVTVSVPPAEPATPVLPSINPWE